MPRTQKIITPKGSRYPGSGRVKGQPNRVSVEVRQLVGELMTNIDYQLKLRHDFALRKVHPTIEALIWTYHLGKPRQDINVNATVDVNQRIEEERRIFASLDVRDLEVLAAESQGLVDRAMALAKLRADAATPPHLAVEADLPEVSEETLGNMAGSDNTRYVNHSPIVDSAAVNPADTEDSARHEHSNDGGDSET